MRNQTSTKVNQLMTDVEELLAELSDHPSPDIEELRGRVQTALGSIRQAIGRSGEAASARLGRFVTSMDDYVTHYPRLAFTSGVLAAGLLGYLVGVTSRSKAD